MSQPLLSIGMIVKNEERCLEKCLNALEPLRQAIPCELVIADTGSTDKTKEIASKYADILFDFTWVNDFSAARNAVMDKCSGKWYLTVDADEYLLEDIKEIVSFLTGPLADKKVLASIVQRNYEKPDMKGIYTDFNALRMVRMDTNRRYTGTIHEHFGITDVNECHALFNTIFDHDGYTRVTPEHLEEKEKRNLVLLEANLKKEPKNIKYVLQCLESTSKTPQKRKYYTNYAMKVLKEKNLSDPNWNTFAATCAYQATNYADYDKAPDLLEWYDWVFKTFPKSDKILVDVKYTYTLRLYAQEKYDEAIKSGKEYLTALSNYKKHKSNTNILTYMNPLTRTHIIYENTINVVIANSMTHLERFDEAIKILEKIDLTQSNNNIISIWTDSIVSLKNSSAKKVAGKVLSNLFEQYKANTLIDISLYDFAIRLISDKFSCSKKLSEDYKVFSEVPGTIGLCSKIAKSKTKEEVEKYLIQIENWDEFMPLALKKAILLKAKLPQNFYLSSHSKLASLEKELGTVVDEIQDSLTDYYCDSQNLKHFSQVSFFFNLLLYILFNNLKSLDSSIKSKLIDRFIAIAKFYLSSCYNRDFLKNEDAINCLFEPHVFSYYLLKATSQKEQNPLDYIKTLKKLLKKVPQAKVVVEFLMDEFKKEEDTKEQEKIKNTSPELLAMAEQLKTMLSAFPPNSPELLAIKQSPMYKQVAFLIEE